MIEEINFSDSVSIADGIRFLRNREGNVKIINIIYINEQLKITFKKLENGNEQEKNHAL
jgi:hypothetical protein